MQGLFVCCRVQERAQIARSTSTLCGGGTRTRGGGLKLRVMLRASVFDIMSASLACFYYVVALVAVFVAPARGQQLRLLSMWRVVGEDGFALSPCSDAGARPNAICFAALHLK